ncbi:hypothetical protein ASE27_10100 [Oerskovia sp. Root918]|uniref:hypothetical protein n=1 Tax=Oerskovia sp. Root918 TaxID=1736607 RepID=UPI0006F456AD|nr:hypothetical protein [Oerskovia sp. Root918]KRD36798.1 hypothetical protein ASE27_10100 [Oerskovia sp. Root918]
MTPPPAGTPWWAWLLAVVLLALIASGTTVLAQRPMQRKLDAVAVDAREAREQTANEHADAEYPNLRDELTAVHETLRDVAAGQGRLEEGQKRHDSEIGGIRHTQRQQTDALARLDERMEGRDAEQRREHAVLAKRLDDHLDPTN